MVLTDQLVKIGLFFPLKVVLQISKSFFFLNIFEMEFAINQMPTGLWKQDGPSGVCIDSKQPAHPAVTL